MHEGRKMVAAKRGLERSQWPVRPMRGLRKGHREEEEKACIDIYIYIYMSLSLSLSWLSIASIQWWTQNNAYNTTINYEETDPSFTTRLSRRVGW